tara:strand:- start:499 stop:840 length:342 start_codon:yes stop_codon:yes gene_type:complete
MEWKDIALFHKNPPTIRIPRQEHVQSLYDKEKLSEEELKSKLFSNNKVWVMTKNKFPYHFIDDTQHYLIWFKNKPNFKLVEFLLRDYEYVYFENSPENRSIKGISHVHVFIKG